MFFLYKYFYNPIKESKMAELKKTPFQTVQDDVISMDFDENPNIPTANYSEETLKVINDTIKKKQRAEKLKKIIDQELKPKSKGDDDDMGLSFSFSSM
jgi:hypothetical protein